jgi:hypothetical protein
MTAILGHTEQTEQMQPRYLLSSIAAEEYWTSFCLTEAICWGTRLKETSAA